MNKFKIMLCVFGFISFALTTFGQQIITKPELTQNALQTVNRSISISKHKQNRTVVKVNAQPDPGIVWIKGIQFQSGIIEFDVKGKDILQESFVGIAFHGVNNSTYEAVYFRPFNFHATDTNRRNHAVQYIALPEYDWEYLRESFPDEYEAPLPTPVDPNDWFHVKIIVDDNAVKTFINADTKPVLVVQSLLPHSSGKIGFWTGNDSEGEFANLVITSRRN
jgi:hypothetical protein